MNQTIAKPFIPKFINTLVRSLSIPETPVGVGDEMVGDDAKITVNQALGKVSLVYERLRTVVDYGEEQTLRKNAIFRIIKRMIVIEHRREQLGKTLIQELIRIHYLPNNAIPGSKADDIEQLLSKYFALGAEIYRTNSGHAARRQLFWWLHIAAGEVEATLFDLRQRQTLVDSLTVLLKRDVVLPESINATKQEVLIGVAARRALFNSDEVALHTYLVGILAPDFFSVQPTPDTIKQLVTQWAVNQLSIEALLRHPLKNKLGNIARRYAVLLLILRDVLIAHPDKAESIITHPRQLEAEVASICSQHYRETRTKVVRSVVRSIIYIFITKMLLAFLLEMPFDYFLEARFNRFTLAINVLFPPFLMFLIGLLIQFPKDKNTQQVVTELKTVVYQTENTPAPRYHIRRVAARRGIAGLLFNLFYLITYGITFGAVIAGLRWLHFNVFSGAMFIFFLCVVSFFGIRIRLMARELIIVDRKESFLNLLLDFLSLPIVRMGHWLSVKLSKINVFVFVLDFIIEAPLKIVLEVIEDWFSFVREKKEEVL